MPKKINSIPVNKMASHLDGSIAIERIFFKNLSAEEKAKLNDLVTENQSHRHDLHSFFLLESGIVHLEIDFQKFIIKAPSVIYIHPDQVHHTVLTEDVVVSSWAIDNVNLNPEYIKILKDITPAQPLPLTKETFSIIAQSVSLFIEFSNRRNDRLYHSLQRDSCNSLVALVLSQYLASTKPMDKLSRFETVTKSFRALLEKKYINLKGPAAYAKELHLSTAYLNECVKNATGYPVSYHIQQRIILEAKRLLHHSDQSVKEIAASLGYDDYPYFSRFFTKITGMSALAFRNKP